MVPSFLSRHATVTVQGLTFEERIKIMDQTSVELAQASVKDWSFIAVTRFNTSRLLAENRTEDGAFWEK